MITEKDMVILLVQVRPYPVSQCNNIILVIIIRFDEGKLERILPFFMNLACLFNSPLYIGGGAGKLSTIAARGDARAVRRRARVRQFRLAR